MRWLLAAAATKVAVVGGGTAGLSASVLLKKLGDFHVTVLEARNVLGGATRTTQWGQPTDWNEGQVDSGWVIASRHLYPNFFSFADEAALPHERHPLDIGYQAQAGGRAVTERSSFAESLEGSLGLEPAAKAQLSERQQATLEAAEHQIFGAGQQLLAEHMARFPGAVGELERSVKGGNPVLELLLGSRTLPADFDLLTMEKRTPADHAATGLDWLNLTGHTYHDFPVGGRNRWVQVAAKSCDQVKLGAKVSRVRGGPQPSVEWTDAQGQHKEHFDAVVMTLLPSQLAEVLAVDGDDRKTMERAAQYESENVITIHRSKKILEFVNGTAPYYHVMQLTATGPGGSYRLTTDADRKDFAVNVFANRGPNGPEPPFVTFWPVDAANDRKMFEELVPRDTVYEEYVHRQHSESGDFQELAKLLRNRDGRDNVHLAGVWTANARFGEAAWASGMRAALHIAQRDPVEYAAKLPACQARAFRRYGLWHQGIEPRDRAVHPECYRDNGLVPSYFSMAEYEAMVARLQGPKETFHDDHDDVAFDDDDGNDDDDQDADQDGDAEAFVEQRLVELKKHDLRVAVAPSGALDHAS